MGLQVRKRQIWKWVEEMTLFRLFTWKLSSEVDRELAEILQNNEEYLDHRWSLLERLVLVFSLRPYESAVRTGLAFIILSLILYVSWPSLRLFVPNYTPWKEVLEWRTVVLGSQIAIIGVVFPLVVGFIGQLLRDKSAANAIWHVYKRYSNFMFVGSSGLFLSLLIIIQLLALPWFNYQLEVATSIGFFLWFLLNLLFTSWFLWSTSQFIEENKKHSAITKYCINEALVSEIRRKLTHIIPINIFRNEPFSNIAYKQEKCVVKGFLYSEPESPEYEYFKRPKYVRDIRLGFLYIFVKAWRDVTEHDADAELAFPLSSARAAKRKHLLVSSKGLKLDDDLLCLLRRVFIYSSRSPTEDADVDSIIRVLTGAIEDALLSDNIGRFEDAIEQFRSWYLVVLSCSNYAEADGTRRSAMLIEDLNSHFGRSLMDEVSKRLWDIMRTSASKIPTSTQFHRDLSAVFLWLFYNSKSKVPAEVASKLLVDQHNVWQAIRFWRSSLSHEIPKQLEANYAEVIKSFIGNWEAWLRDIPSRNREHEQFTDFDKPILQDHISNTAAMTFYSAKGRDKLSIRYSADSLIRWLEHYDLQLGRQSFPLDKLVNLSNYDKSSEKNFFVRFLSAEAPIRSEDLRAAAIKNMWIDVQIISACFLLSQDWEDFGKEALAVALGIVNHEKLIGFGGSLYSSESFLTSASDVLVSYLRIHFDFGVNGPTDSSIKYREFMDRLCEKAYHIQEEEWISGRFYMREGEIDVGSLTPAFLALTALKSQGPWTLGPQLQSFLTSDMLNISTRDRVIRLLTRLTDVDPGPVLAKLMSGENEESEIFVSHCRKSLQDLVDTLDQANNDAIEAAEIDPAILLRVEKHASRNALSSSSQHIPTSLFQQFIFTEDRANLSEFCIPILDFKKAKLCPSLGVAGIEDWSDEFTTMLDENSAKNLLDLVLETVDIEVRNVLGVRVAVDSAVSEARELARTGHHPVIIVANDSIDELLYATRHGGYDNVQPLPNNAEFRQGFESEYVVHLDDIPVYRLPDISRFDVAVTCREKFNSLYIRPSRQGNPVTADYQPTSSVKEVNLVFTYSVDSDYSADIFVGYKLKEGNGESDQQGG